MLPSGVNLGYSRWEYKQGGTHGHRHHDRCRVGPRQRRAAPGLGRRRGHLLGRAMPTRTTPAVRGYHDELLAAAGSGRDDSVLDVGCGAGQTTIDAARVAASALGVDLSSAMLDVARRRARGGGADQRDVPPGGRAGPPVRGLGLRRRWSAGPGRCSSPTLSAAFANLARAVRVGGRLAILVWQPVPRNEWFREFTTALAAGRDLPGPPPGAPGPFSLSDPDATRSLLRRTGWSDVDLARARATDAVRPGRRHRPRLRPRPARLARRGPAGRAADAARSTRCTT